ncbi:MAG: phosphonoacetaldehyde hydrolase [Clostridium sp.]
MKNIKGVISDWAGTLVDYGCIAPLETIIDVFKQKGIIISREIAKEPMGLGKRDHIEVLLNSESVKKQWERKYGRPPNDNDLNDLYNKFIPHLLNILERYSLPIDGVEELLEYLRSEGIKIGTTSGYTREMMECVFKCSPDVLRLVDNVVTSDEVEISRPAPLMIYKNQLQLNMYPSWKIVKFGDTIADIDEGRNAGVWTIGIIKGGSLLGLSKREISTMNRKQIRDSVEDVKEKFINAGADFVANSVLDIKDILKIIDEKIQNGEKPNILKEIN